MHKLYRSEYDTPFTRSKIIWIAIEIAISIANQKMYLFTVIVQYTKERHDCVRCSVIFDLERDPDYSGPCKRGNFALR